MRALFLFLALLLLSPPFAEAATFDFSPWGRLLERHLSENREIHAIPANTLDYQALAGEAGQPGGDWQTLLRQLETFNPAAISDRNERMAFWINIYNIAAIKTILDHWPVDSIRSRSINWLKSPWKTEIITVGGRRYSLHQIEFDQLVEGFHDLRAHLGINCASTSCVDLLPVPFSGPELDRQLQQQGERLANQPAKGLAIDMDRRLVRISRIFDFDAEHFDAWAGGGIRFLLPYVRDPKARAFLESGNYRVEFLDYDWTLNDTRLSRTP
ncbi:MAG: DUF547 domain-containing protein [Geothermobacteraceae bacterium]